jgi:hypothetical protein
MNEEQDRLHVDGRMEAAIAELQALIGQRYPDTTFSLSHPDDEPTSVELTAVVDVDDPDEVLDMVIDRVVQFQVDEQLPIHVVPIRTPARVAAYLSERRQPGHRPRRSLSLLETLAPPGR